MHNVLHFPFVNFHYILTENRVFFSAHLWEAMSNNKRRLSKDIIGEPKKTKRDVHVNAVSAKNTLRCLQTFLVHFLMKCDET